MTKWEIGQDLIDISDMIGEKELEIRKSNKIIADRLRLVRLMVGDLFEDNNDHDFSILNSSNIKYRKEE